MFAYPYLAGLLDGACTDLLSSPGLPQQAAFMMNVVVQGAAGVKSVFNGPVSTTDTETGQVYATSAWLLTPVFVSNVSKDEDFGYSYNDSPASMKCVESGPCYNSTTSTKWWGHKTLPNPLIYKLTTFHILFLQRWGFVTSFFDFQPLISGNESSLDGLTDHGFGYKITAPDPWTSKPVLVGQVGPVNDAACVQYKFNIPYDKEEDPNPWVLSIYPNDGWDPEWKAPLIAAVVILSVVISSLVSVTVVGMYRQRYLLKESHTANGKLVTLAKSLEEEKKNSDALVARQLALIECLGREAEQAQSKKAREREKQGKGSETSSFDADSTKLLSVQQIDLIRKDLVGRTSKMTSRSSIGQGFQIPDLEILHIIGEGSFGKVFKCLWRGSTVALKSLLLPANMSRQEKREKMVSCKNLFNTALYSNLS